MTYTISEIASRYGLTTYTLRYYDKIGLLPNIKRNSGRRVFDDDDVRWLDTLSCLKETGMSLDEIKEYIDLQRVGDSTLEKRRNLILNRQKAVLLQIDNLNKTLNFVNWKLNYYDYAIKNGSEKAAKEHFNLNK